MRTLSLQRLYQLAGLAMAFGCLALGGIIFLTNLQEYQRYRVGAQELARFQSVLEATTWISSERGPANSFMGAPPATRPQLQAALNEARSATDQALTELEAQIGHRLSGASTFDLTVDDLRAQLARARRAVDMATTETSKSTHGSAVARAIEQMFLVADASARLRDQFAQNIVMAYPQISTEIILGTVCSNLREYAGRFGSYAVMMLTSPSQDHGSIMRNLMETKGQLTELRRLISTYTHAFAGLAPVEEGLVELDRAYFSDALPFARRIAETAHSAPEPIDAAEFTRLYVPGMQSIDKLRGMISDISMAQLDKAREIAGRMLIISSILTIAICSVLALINIVLNRTLFRPLIAGKEQIIAIARGDLKEPLLTGRIGREVQEMFDSLKILREHERRKRVLERNQELMAEQLRHLSETDDLTGLLNRRALEVRASSMLVNADTENAPLSVILFDIDHFKSINDTYGHGLGDLVLQSVGPTLRPFLDPQDTFARFGGEEFVVLLKDEEGQRATRLAEKLRGALADMAGSQKLEFSVTASFGVATGRPGAENWEMLITKADQRLYKAKRQGRNRVCAG